MHFLYGYAAGALAVLLLLVTYLALAALKERRK